MSGTKTRARLKATTAKPDSALPPPGTPPERMADVTDVEPAPPGTAQAMDPPAPRYMLYVTMWYRKRDGGSGHEATTVADMPNITRISHLASLKQQLLANNPDLTELVILDWKSLEG